MQSERKSFLKNMVGFSMTTWISFALGFIASPLATRLFLPQELAQVSLFSTYAGLFSSLCYAGLDQAYVRFFREPPNRITTKTLFNFCVFVVLAIGIMVSVCLFFFIKPLSVAIAGKIDWRIICCLVVYIGGIILFRFLSLNYRMENNAMLYTIQGVVYAFLTKLAYLAVGFGTAKGVQAIMLLTCLMCAFSIVAVFVQRKRFSIKSLKLINKKAVSEIAIFSLPLVPLALFSYINNSMSQLALNSLMGKMETGIFSSALGLASTVNIIQSGFNTYWAPYVMENYATNKKNRFDAVHKLMACILCLFGLTLTLFQSQLFLFLGENYRSAMVFFPFLVMSPICYCLGETTGLGITLSKKTYWTTIIYMVTACMNIALCYLLIPLEGMAGAAMASAFTAVVTLILRTIVGEHFYKAIEKWWYLFWAIGLMLCGSFVSLYLRGAVKYTVISMLLLIALFIFRAEARILWNLIVEIFETLKRKIRRKSDKKEK